MITTMTTTTTTTKHADVRVNDVKAKVCEYVCAARMQLISRECRLIAARPERARRRRTAAAASADVDNATTDLSVRDVAVELLDDGMLASDDDDEDND